MPFKTRLFLLLLLAHFSVFAQETGTIHKDSLKQTQKEKLEKLEDLSKQSKVGKFVHRLIFKPINKKRKSRNIERVSFASSEGKIIRNIHITTLDPFGFSVSDTARIPDTWLEKAGNSIHVKTKQFTIRNLLLFRKNQPLDSLLIRESERLIRSQGYVRQVTITPQPLSEDSVDVHIRVLDSWSLVPDGAITSTKGTFTLTERNFIGLGHRFGNTMQQDFEDNRTAYSTYYSIPNIWNSYINTTFTYNLDLLDNYQKSININRTFFSPLTRWAGGVYLDQKFLRDSLPDPAQVYALHNFKSETQDFWGGYSFGLSKERTESLRTFNLITALRYQNINYTEKASIIYDSLGYFSDEKLYLASIGISSRQYVQDKYLYNYDIIEDIPIGRNYILTGGFRNKNHQKTSYFGAKYAVGNYYNWGYFSSSIEAGSFFDSGEMEQSTINLKALYFTNLKQYGSWHFRQFIQPQLVLGFNRMDFVKDRLTMAGTTGIEGLNQFAKGTHKAQLTLQTQSYAPGMWYGFRFSPFLNFTMGFLGDKDHFILDSRMYSRIGLGVLITNDYLVFNSFQISFAFYPVIPNEGSDIFKTNSFKNSDFGLQDFQIGKPMVVPFE
ncbi:MAG: POTRA domain-containing protein [Flavobacteriaceae bacterium]